MLNTHISRYVALHRSLGRKFREQDRMLRLFAAYAEGFGDRRTKVQRIYDWCHTSSSQNVAQRRFDTVRNFSLFAHAEDLGHQVPPAGVFGQGKRPRPTPTIIEPEGRVRQCGVKSVVASGQHFQAALGVICSG